MKTPKCLLDYKYYTWLPTGYNGLINPLELNPLQLLDLQPARTGYTFCHFLTIFLSSAFSFVSTDPGRPWNLVLKARSSSVITVQWQEPRNPNGIIRKYKIIYTDNPSTDEKAWKSQEAGGTSASLRSLKRDVKYWVRVAAFTSVGIGENSKIATVKTLKFDRKFLTFAYGIVIERRN